MMQLTKTEQILCLACVTETLKTVTEGIEASKRIKMHLIYVPGAEQLKDQLLALKARLEAE